MFREETETHIVVGCDWPECATTAEYPKFALLTRESWSESYVNQGEDDDSGVEDTDENYLSFLASEAEYYLAKHSDNWGTRSTNGIYCSEHVDAARNVITYLGALRDKEAATKRERQAILSLHKHPTIRLRDIDDVADKERWW